MTKKIDLRGHRVIYGPTRIASTKFLFGMKSKLIGSSNVGSGLSFCAIDYLLTHGDRSCILLVFHNRLSREVDSMIEPFLRRYAFLFGDAWR